MIAVRGSGDQGDVTTKFKLKNATSLTSLLYGLWPNSWNVTARGDPFSNWVQIYEWRETFPCKCK